MKNKTTLMLLAIFLLFFVQLAHAESFGISSDRAQTALDMTTVQCQRLNDYADKAARGDQSSFSEIKTKFGASIENISFYIGAFDRDMINSLWMIYDQFTPDPYSAQYAAAECRKTRDRFYQKLFSGNYLNRPKTAITNFNECAEAGNLVSGETCFAGGNVIYDDAGNIIGIYNADCYIGDDFYSQSCWFCLYGNDSNGCMPRS